MSYAISISQRQTRHVLKHAIQTHAQVLVEPVGIPDKTLLGFVSSGDDEVLLLELTGRGAARIDGLVGRCCNVQLFTDERYLFTSNIVQGPAWHNGEQLAISSPKTLQVIQRRRFWRAQLAPSSRVTLEWSEKGRPERAVAALLNVSTEGLACRLPSPPRRLLENDTRLRVDFELPGSPGRFRFEAVICNHAVTSEGACIVGMQFDVDAADGETVGMQGRLREFLYRPQALQAALEPIT